MKKEFKLKQNIRSACALSAIFLAAQSMAVPALASPEFARSAEEWAQLGDNKLEWGEIAGLVHEYNATVLNNQKAYQKDSGQDAEEIRNSLLDAADDMDELANAADDGEAGAMTAAGYRAQAEQLRSQADNNVSDSDVIRWQYDQVEANIVQSVQNHFIGYYQAIAEKEGNEAKLPYLEQAYQSALNRKNVGTATELDVLTAQENLQTAQAALATADANIASYQKKMQVLCGWNYDASAEIGALPDYDMSSIADIDLAADTEKALANSYQLRIDERKLKNAPDMTLRDQYQKTVDTDKQQIRSSVKTAYDTLIQAKSDYDTTAAELALKQQSLEKSSRQYALGTISRMDYAAAENEVTTLQNSLKLKELAVFSAQTAYNSAVGGLASAGSVS